MKLNYIALIGYGLAINSLTFGLTSAQTSTDPALSELYAASISAPAYQILSLQSALRAAESYNPRIIAARLQYAISETDIRLARSGRKPLIEANASYGYLDQDNSFTSAPGSSLSGETSNIGLSLRQPLFRGFQTNNAIKRAKPRFKLRPPGNKFS